MDTINTATITEKIKSEGRGAGDMWMTIATSAMAGNRAAKAECEKLLGRPVANMGDYWQIMCVCRELMTPGELASMANRATQLLNAGASGVHEADRYIFARRLADLRRDAGMTQEELSERSGVQLGTLRKLEQGGDMMAARTSTMLALAKALGMSVEEVVGGVNI